MRKLGLPTVRERLSQQAVLHVLQPAWDTTFADSSSGLRPERSAHQAVAQAQQSLEDGYDWVVAREREQCFDRVKHDTLRSLGKGRRAERRVWQRIER